MTPPDTLSPTSPGARRPGPWARRRWLVAGMAVIGLAVLVGGALLLIPRSVAPEQAASRPSMNVTLGSTSLQVWPATIQASGAVAAWQETIIGAQVGGLQLREVRVNVGDRVRRGQILATFDPAAPRAEVARLSAALAQAVAGANQAGANRARAESLEGSGGISAQEVLRYVTEAETAQAGVQAARAALEAAREQLRYVEVRAPDDGVIVARTATPGSVGGVGIELFRMIRHGRLEWRGELTAAQLAEAAPGQRVELSLPGGGTARGRIRQKAPGLEPVTRLGLVYADIVQPGSARAGMYAEGRIFLPERPAVTAPAASVVLRDGRHYLYTVTPDGENLVVSAREVTPGRRQGTEIEILDGVVDQRFVVTGAGFLKDGDVVREVRPAPPPARPTARPAA